MKIVDRCKTATLQPFMPYFTIPVSMNAFYTNCIAFLDFQLVGLKYRGLPRAYNLGINRNSEDSAKTAIGHGVQIFTSDLQAC